MSPIGVLALAMASFVGTHLLLSHPLRAGFVARLGAGPFLGLYSLIAFATLGWTWRARTRSGDGLLWWVAGPGLWDLATLAMLLASILLAGSLMGNPAFPKAPADQAPAPEPRGVFAITRHPMNWSFALWAFVHLAVWGSAANLILTVGILILAVAGSLGQDTKKTRLEGARWRDWTARTSFVPFTALASGRIPWSAALPGWRATLLGLAIFLAATWAHAPLAGLDVGVWRWLG